MTVWGIEIEAMGEPPVPCPFRDPERASLHDQLKASPIGLVSFTAEMATRAARLPIHHQAPFDRALVATAQRLGAPIISFDRRLACGEGIDRYCR